MKNRNDNRSKPDNTSLTPLQPETPVEETKLRHLTDEEIIRGFRYLMHKDKKDK